MQAPSGLFVLFLLAAAALPAGSPLNRLPRDAAGVAVRRGIEYAGGWDAWESKKSIVFRKTMRKFRPDGSIEFTRVQIHRYRLQPSFAARIEWEERGQKTILINDGHRAWKFVDGREVTSEADVNNARNSTFGSHYVFGIPFKLTDPGAHLEDAGRGTLGDGTPVRKVRVFYDRGTGDAGGLHNWTYYFDTKSGRLCANHLKYATDKYDFTEYADDTTVDGIRFATLRTDYEADARGKAGPRISEILYEDVRFNTDLPDAVFSVPPRQVPPGGSGDRKLR
jgi:hypothetical protein